MPREAQSLPHARRRQQAHWTPACKCNRPSSSSSVAADLLIKHSPAAPGVLSRQHSCKLPRSAAIQPGRCRHAVHSRHKRGGRTRDPLQGHSWAADSGGGAAGAAPACSIALSPDTACCPQPALPSSRSFRGGPATGCATRPTGDRAAGSGGVHQGLGGRSEAAEVRPACYNQHTVSLSSSSLRSSRLTAPLPAAMQG